MQVKCPVRQLPVGGQSSAPVRLCLLLVVLEKQCWLPACLLLPCDHQAKCEAAGSLSVLASEIPEESLSISVFCDNFSFPREIALENSFMIPKVEVC